MELIRPNNFGASMKSRWLLFIIAIGFVSVSTSPAWAYDSSNIDLGTVSYQSLSGKPGASGAAKVVSIAFDNCSTGTSSVTLTFSGFSFSGNGSSIYVNELVYGAKNVGLQLQSAVDQKSLGPGDTYTYFFNSGPEQIFNMNARMYTPNGQVTTGNVAFTVTFNVSYK